MSDRDELKTLATTIAGPDRLMVIVVGALLDIRDSLQVLASPPVTPQDESGLQAARPMSEAPREVMTAF